MAGDVRFMQGGGVEHDFGADQGPGDEICVADIADMAHVGRRETVQTDDFVAARGQAPDQRLAQVSRGAGDDRLHSASGP